jgi:hypothetical protein
VVISKRSRRWLSGWLVLALLFMQFATAAYACPTKGQTTTVAASDASPCALMMAGGAASAIDPDQPGLCIKHCQPDSSRLDPGQAASVPAATCEPTLTVALSPPPDADVAAWAAQRRIRDRAPPPAHSILHCCYRI